MGYVDVTVVDYSRPTHSGLEASTIGWDAIGTNDFRLSERPSSDGVFYSLSHRDDISLYPLRESCKGLTRHRNKQVSWDGVW